MCLTKTMAFTVRCFVSLYVYVVSLVLLCECPRGMRAENEGPIVAPFMILTPYKRIVLQKDTVNVIFSIDAELYIIHIVELASVHQNITEKIRKFNITFLTLNSLSTHARILIENLASNLVNALQVLPQEEECKARRRKRNVDILA